MNAKFTPGPWAVGEPNDFATSEIGVHSDKWCLLDMCMDIRDKSVDQEANARLIAASPTMYEYIVRRAEIGDSEAKSILETINASR